MLGAKPKRVQLVWTDGRTTDFGYYRGPAEAWLAADGGPPEGSGSVRPPRGHHILPLRSTSIPVSLVSALARNRVAVSLVPLRVRPTIYRVEAIAKLRRWGDARKRLQGIWLVWFRRGGNGRKQLAWMAVTLQARVPILGCMPGKKCKHLYPSPLASFLNARSGTFIEALTINGWKRPQLPPG